MGWGNIVDYGTPVGWVGKGLEAGGVIDESFGKSLEKGASSLFKERGSDTPDLDPRNFQVQGFSRRRDQLLREADFVGGRQAPTFGQSQFRGDQRGLVQMLQRQAAGQGPSAAGLQLREGLGRNVSQQQAMLASGGNARAAAQQASALGGSLSNQLAQARVQEQLGAQQMLGQTLQGARGQDLQRNIALSDAELRSRGLNDQQIARLRQMELENAKLSLTGTMGLEEQRTARRGQDLGVPTTGEQIIGAASSALGAIS